MTQSWCFTLTVTYLEFGVQHEFSPVRGVTIWPSAREAMKEL